MGRDLLHLNQTILRTIQDSVVQFAEVIAKTVDTDVLIVDNNLKVVGETLLYYRLYSIVDIHSIIGQVLVNLITNAADHTKAGGQILITSEIKDKKCHINVFNEGEPIPEDELDKIWLSFYKRNKARTRTYGGTGIGLTIVKTIMENHNNTCGVFNGENGVNFWFEFDIDENPDDDFDDIPPELPESPLLPQ